MSRTSKTSKTFATKATVIDSTAEEKTSYFANLFANMPSATRVVISWISGVAVSALGMSATSMIANSLAVLALTMTTSMFIAYAVYFFLSILGLIASVYAGAYVQSWIVSGGAKDSLDAAGSWVRRQLTRKETSYV